MKQILITILLGMLVTLSYSQGPINIGLKFGTNSSKLITNFDDVLNQNLEENNINNYFTGAFVRASIGRFYAQPEIYFNNKGGVIAPIGSSQIETPSTLNFQTIDLPVIIGFKIINKPLFNLRLHGGPLFSFVTTKSLITEISDFKTSDLNNNYVGWQLGTGIDIWFLTFDARIENTTNILNEMSQYKARNRVYLLSAGIKLF